MKKIILFFIMLFTISLSFANINIKANDNYLEYSGKTVDAAGEINAFLVKCKMMKKNAYFKSGVYTLNGNVNLQNGVSLYTEDNAVFRSTNKQYVLTSEVNDVSNITIDGFVFDNVAIFLGGSNTLNYVISNNVFLNGKKAIYNDSGITPDTGYYILKKHGSITIKSNIFLRDSQSLGRGIGLYKTESSLIEDNYFGVIEDLEKSILSDNVKNKGKMITALDTYDKESDQGYFMTAINVISGDKNSVILSNHFSLNTDITEPTTSNDGKNYHRDHIIYAKEFDGLTVVGNYFKGQNKNADGGVKIRNGENATVINNVFDDVMLLYYIQNQSAITYLKNIYTVNNIFINRYYTSQKVTDASGAEKNLSDPYLILLRVYNTNNVIENINISDNLCISNGLANEQIRIHRRITTSTEISMDSNIYVANNKNVFGDSLLNYDYGKKVNQSKDDINNGTIFIPTIEAKYKDIDMTSYVYNDYRVTFDENKKLVVPQDSLVYNDDKSLYNNDVLSLGTHKFHIFLKDEMVINCNGNKHVVNIYNYSPSTIVVANHTLGELIEKVEPTCDNDGYIAHYVCSDCNKYVDKNGNILDSIVIDKLGHIYGDCISNQDGTHYQSCNNDAAHTLESNCLLEWVVTKEAGDSAGEKIGTCKECGYEVVEVIPPVHDCEFKDFIIDKAPTCTESGEMSKHCVNENCNERTEITVIDPTGHKNDNIEKNDSSHWYLCDCGVKHGEVAHEFTSKVVKEATNKEMGKIEHTCNACGYVKTEDIPMVEGSGCNGSINSLIISVSTLFALLVLIRRRKLI